MKKGNIRGYFLPGVEARKRELRTQYGFPSLGAQWCTSELKTRVLEQNLRISDTTRGVVQQPSEDVGICESKHSKFSTTATAQGGKKSIVRYLGIAADEPKRISRHNKPGIILPLVDIGWDEAFCRRWCEENDLLSPIYTSSARGGCWFCHNQSVDQLRLLRMDYPDLWELLLRWDKDSPTTFKPDGHTVHDFELRFRAEDEGKIKAGDRRFRCKSVLDT